mmetsp:Transcript_17758/g.50278  ORF Transcript_17758/g.50278 Transcript_17758/m.50278 type:complete len:743 (-) Transcript_17758:96-2324(-)
MAVRRGQYDIRCGFADVASYVGHSTRRHGSSPQSRASPNQSRDRVPAALAVPLDSPSTSVSASKEAMPSVTSMSKDSSLPMIHAGRTERVRCQLQFLRAEQRAENEQLKKLEVCLSDSELHAKQAHQRAEKQRKMHQFHQQRAQRVEKQIKQLHEELNGGSSPAQGDSAEVRKPGPAWESLGSSPTPPHLRGSATRLPPPQVASPSNGATFEPLANTSSSSGFSHPDNTAMVRSAPAALERVDQHREPKKQGARSPAATATATPSSSRQVCSVSTSTGPWKDKRQARPVFLDLPAAGERDAEGGRGSATGSQADTDIQHLPGSERTDNDEVSDEGSEEDLTPRTKIRRAMIKQAGSPTEAFKKLDLNRRGTVSLTHFVDGVDRMGLKWTKVKGLKKTQDLFRLFDSAKDGVIDYTELFPDEVGKTPPRSVSTPEFWGRWCRKNSDPENLKRGPRWQPGTREEELGILFKSINDRDQSTDKRKKMSATFRRLKGRGKSDARCREIVALHLPRGTGPRDREEVSTFSETDVRACRKSYQERVLEPAKNIQKVVCELRDQRRVLSHSRHQLWTVSMEPLMRKKAEEERRNQASGLVGGFSLLSKVKDPEDAAAAATAPGTAGSGAQGSAQDPAGGTKSFKVIIRELSDQGIVADEEFMEDLFKEYIRFADVMELLGRKAFGRLLQALCSARTLAATDIEAWWLQVIKSLQGAPPNDGRPQRVQCNFEMFSKWFASSELRAAGDRE